MLFVDIVIFVYRSRESLSHIKLMWIYSYFKENSILKNIFASKIIMLQKYKILYIYFQQRATFWITIVP